LEATNAYYSEMKRLGLDINRETDAYKIYQKWLHVRETFSIKETFSKKDS